MPEPALNEQPSLSRYRVLLIGIDAYPVKPLHGCVNDIDAVQRLLLGRLGISPGDIRRLASPHPGAHHDTSVLEQPATLANIRAAFAELGSELVAPGDRVFIYYSGHGARAAVRRADGGTFHRESLVPVDVASTSNRKLFFDHELNGALQAIARRTRSVSLVLDCCHAAGATRDPGQHQAVWRFLDLEQDLGWIGPIPDPGPTQVSRGADLAQSIDDCHVVSACLNHERAQEDLGGEVWHGVLTRALIGALSEVTNDELPTVRWGRIWQAVRSAVESHNPWQHPWMAGNAARAVLAGPPVDGDMGYGIQRVGDTYVIAAGMLAGITSGAMLAIYGEQPPMFPLLDSQEDRAARLGVAKVISAERSTAQAYPEGAWFELPPGARARLVKAGSPARLRCAVLPPDPVAVASLRESPLIEVVDPPLEQVRLNQAGARWLLNDDVHEADADSALITLEAGDLRRARDVLEHYFHYALPLRMAALSRDLPGALEIAILMCEKDLSPAQAQEAKLPEAPTQAASTYDLRSGDRVCFRVYNRWTCRLRVTLLNSAASGKVQLLGDQVIDAGSAYVFWAASRLGSPFSMSPPPGKQQCIDRLTAVGTTSMTADLRYLRVDRTFVDAIARLRGHTRDVGTKDIGGDEDVSPPVEQWTATQAIVRTRAR